MQTLQTASSSHEEAPATLEETHSQHRPSINEMRDLVGLGPIEDASQEADIEDESSRPYQDSLVDENDFSEEEEDLATKRKPWQQGLPKLAIVATPLGGVCLLVMIVLSSVTGMKLADKNDATGEVAVIESTDEAEIQQQQEAEIARLKTSNALGNQASILDSQPTRQTEIRPTAQPASARQVERVQQPAPAVQPQPQTQTPAQQPAPRTRPVAVSRAPITPAPRQSVQSAAPVPVSVNRSQPQAQLFAEQTPVDPFTQWQKLAAVGSYGQVSDSISSVEHSDELAEVSTETTIPVLVGNVGTQRNIQSDETDIATEDGPPLPSVRQDDYLDEEAIAVESDYETQNKAFTIQSLGIEATAPRAQKVSYWTTQGEATDPDQFETAQVTEIAQQDSYEAGASYIMRNAQPIPEPQFTRRETTLLPGLNAAGQVITPVAWAQDIQSTAGSIELTEDLISNGSVIMPAGTQLTVALDEMSASGMMRLTVTSIILPEAGYEHMQIPTAAITIQGAGGQVLMAKDISGVDGELRRIDRNQALLGALGTVGSILNRPSSSINTVGVGGASSSTTYSSPNILGAILEGSANTMIAQRAARNQQRAAALQQRPAIWVLEQGTEIEIFISEAVNIGE